jgi:hypothetical protein
MPQNALTQPTKQMLEVWKNYQKKTYEKVAS